MINVAGKICTFVKKSFAALFQSTLKNIFTWNFFIFVKFSWVLANFGILGNFSIRNFSHLVRFWNRRQNLIYIVKTSWNTNEKSPLEIPWLLCNNIKFWKLSQHFLWFLWKFDCRSSARAEIRIRNEYIRLDKIKIKINPDPQYCCFATIQGDHPIAEQTFAGHVDLCPR